MGTAALCVPWALEGVWMLPVDVQEGAWTWEAENPGKYPGFPNSHPLPAPVPLEVGLT